MKNSYQKRKEAQKHFVLLKKDTVVGVFGSFRQALEKIDSDKKQSYWTLIRNMPSRYDVGDYSLQVVKNP
ncbi:hypothetical protein V1387_04290 [Allomuricauda taeanensis]|uniref:hypothetical protein n=1 Tax=Flagellimonas taeanensis TaxID=1005926 RepID=UPI002E7AE663|nr:hypothetical protein [Allomuricauda taeanensis]MEE1961894.1 hypothetical protein [Allomuricauda taeanensis]